MNVTCDKNISWIVNSIIWSGKAIFHRRQNGKCLDFPSSAFVSFHCFFSVEISGWFVISVIGTKPFVIKTPFMPESTWELMLPFQVFHPMLCDGRMSISASHFHERSSRDFSSNITKTLKAIFLL